jgi:hypothetical protein
LSNVSALPPVPNVCKVQCHWLVGDKPAANVLHWQYSGSGPAPAAYVTALASDIAGAIASNASLWQADTSFLGTTATDLSSDTGFVEEAAATEVGTRTGGILSANVALLASYALSRRYRGGHPRTYLPWFTEADVLNPQEWIGASVTDASAVWDGVVTAGLAAGGGGVSTVDQCQVSYILAGVRRVTPLVNAIVFTQCDQVIASQRRRDGRH